jgi:hypothetical protein
MKRNRKLFILLSDEYIVIIMNISIPEEMERAYGMHKARLGPLFNRKTIYLPEGVREPNNFFKRAVSGALVLLMAGYIGLAPAKASAHMIGPTHVYQLGPSVVQPWSVKATEDNPYKPEGTRTATSSELPCSSNIRTKNPRFSTIRLIRTSPKEMVTLSVQTLFFFSSKQTKILL